MPVSLMVLWAGAPAGAVELTELVEAWTLTTNGLNGSTGEDRAAGIAFDKAGNILAVGWLDGAVDHGTDGYVVQYAQDGSVTWSMVADVGAIDATRTSSDDKYHAIALDAQSDEIALCGRKGQEPPLFLADGRYLVEAYGPAAGAVPALTWDIAYTDGTAANSPQNDCFGVAQTTENVWTVGWGFNHPSKAGHWFSNVLDADDARILEQETSEFTAWEAVPDIARAAAANALLDDYVVVGESGVTGLVGPEYVDNDTDFHVRYYLYDAKYEALTLSWEDTQDYGGLLDSAAAVAIDSLNGGDLVVAGWVNAGGDNADLRDDDWFVVKYDKDGDGLGAALPVWTARYESDTGASERATAVAVDQLGDVFVAGTMIDPLTGLSRWRIGKYDGDTGAELDEWLGVVGSGDSVPYAIAIRNEELAIAGSVANGDAADFAVAFLDSDYDLDGVADAVDGCSADPNKSDPGVCGCGILDQDTDADGVFNCIDGCPSDVNKTDPGLCGCEVSDADTDIDGTPDCDDNCDTDPEKVDWGICGCNAPDTDSDGDGVVGCHDACSNTPAGTPVDEFGCPREDTTIDTGTGKDGGGGGGPGCGCNSPGAPTSALLALGALALVRRRRR